MRLVVCITGASGALYARRMLDVLDRVATGGDARLGHRPDLEVSWVASQTAAQVWAQELGEDLPSKLGTSLRRYDRHDFRAPFASGSNAPDAVIVAPCSMSTLARIAHGGGDDLIARACEVALKERRPLIALARETPLSLVHLRNMVAATEAGATIMPAVPSFYGKGATLEDAIDTVVSRALDHVGLRLELGPRWGTGVS